MARDITVAYGDGIGPEIMEATLRILAEAKAKINIDTIEVGEAYYKRGVSTGIPPHAWDSLRRTGILLKAPITTPQGGGYKSLNVTLRKALRLYANIRPCVSYAPYVKGLHDDMDMVIVRENEEDLYSGIEYQQTANSVHAIKVITRQGCERIVRHAFEYADKNCRKKVTCMSKDNIMKQCDGLFHKVFDEIAAEYPHIESEHYIIDIGSARIASNPSIFDVVVTENLYGDIISDIAADVCGSVGLAGSANIGDDFAMFEAIHGSAPDIAGQNVANPSGLLNGALMMLVHIGQNRTAEIIKNAWLRTLEDGMHTADIYGEHSKEKLGTQEFADAVIERLGQEPERFKKADFSCVKCDDDGQCEVPKPAVNVVGLDNSKIKKELAGVDIFVEWRSGLNELAEKLSALAGDDIGLALHLLSAKGLKIWPNNGEIDRSNSDTIRCRFLVKSEDGDSGSKYPATSFGEVVSLLSALSEGGIDVLKIENLYTFDGKRGWTLAQGE